MNRKTFLTLMAGTTGMAAMGAVRMLHELYTETDVLMPALFVGHGSPMNGIEDNLFSNQWKKLGTQLHVPKAVLVVSAHWLTKGTFVTAVEKPQTIHDFGGFPQALFDAQYPAPGDAQLAQSISQLFSTPTIGLDHEWGLDHGSWTILKHIYPKADIPVLQLSIDYNQPPSYHYELAKALAGGSSFVVRLALPVPAAVAPPASAPVPLESVAGMQVLVVDDNPVNRLLARALLGQIGISSHLANSGPEAIERARQGDLDVILMDMQMPEMDGVEAAQHILALGLRKRPRIIALTASAFDSDREQCLAAGMVDFVSKPFQLAELHRALAGRGQGATSPSASARQEVSSGEPGLR